MTGLATSLCMSVVFNKAEALGLGGTAAMQVYVSSARALVA